MTVSDVLADKHGFEVDAFGEHTVQGPQTALVVELQEFTAYCPTAQTSHISHTVAPFTEVYVSEGHSEQVLL